MRGIVTQVVRVMLFIVATVLGCGSAWLIPAAEAHQNAIASTDEWYLATDDKAARLYVTEIGRGEPVVVLHGGFGAEHSYLLDAVQGLEGKYHFILYDQRGSLRSPCKTELISFDKHVEDLETLRKALGLERMTLFSHSMGTYLAMGYLEKYPARVKNIVMAGALPLKSGKYLDAAYLAAWKIGRDAGNIFLERPALKAELEKAGSQQPHQTAKQQSEIQRIMFASAAIYHIERWREAKGWGAFFNDAAGGAASSSLFKRLGNDYDFAALVDRHPYPVTVISGDYDYADFGNAFYGRYSKEAKNLELITIKDAAHDAWVDDPDRFRHALDAGLSKKPKR